MRLSVTALSVWLAACGGGGRDTPIDVDAAEVQHDAGTPDAAGPPPPPALGPQIDRMGRPAIATTLISLLTPAGAARTAKRDAYNHAADPAAWRTTTLETNVSIERELEVNLAILDALDRGNGIPMAGCGSALKYMSSPSLTSYQFAADLFADDQLYLDTSKGACGVYLELELEIASDGDFIHKACGGRTPSYDVVDVTYSLTISGLAGLDPAGGFRGLVLDGVDAHSDVTTTFPFLAPPH
jgi:hypothetical protein